jgi:hypothetical protein
MIRMRSDSTGTKGAGFNPWPYSIIGVFAVALVAAVVWVGFCIGHGSDLVAADYYEQEVEYQQQMDRLERTRALGAAASVVHEAQSGIIRIRLPQSHVSDLTAGAIHLYRPSEADLDRRIPLALDAAGEQRLETGTLAPGLWEIRVQWTAAGQEFCLTEKLRMGGGQPL